MKLVHLKNKTGGKMKLKKIKLIKSNSFSATTTGSTNHKSFSVGSLAQTGPSGDGANFKSFSLINANLSATKC